MKHIIVALVLLFGLSSFQSAHAVYAGDCQLIYPGGWVSVDGGPAQYYPAVWSCFDGGGGGGGGGLPGAGGGGGGGGGSPTEYIGDCTATDTAGRIEYSRALASKRASDIKGKPDFQSREYACANFLDDGSMRTGELVEGSNVHVGVGPLELSVMGALPDGSNVVGLLHNHPSNNSGPRGSTLYNANRLPSPADWAAADGMFANGASLDLLTLYVLGPDGTLRSYPYKDKAKYFNGTSVSGVLGDTVPSNLEPKPCPA